ncbi:hypothetical protein AL037_13890 [Salipiger aestuarii]|nr:hypothetical protein AL037_13890 [Salipiger aestuarii]
MTGIRWGAGAVNMSDFHELAAMRGIWPDGRALVPIRTTTGMDNRAKGKTTSAAMAPQKGAPAPSSRRM